MNLAEGRDTREGEALWALMQSNSDRYLKESSTLVKREKSDNRGENCFEGKNILDWRNFAM